jgi:hypothetical protein
MMTPTGVLMYLFFNCMKCGKLIPDGEVYHSSERSISETGEQSLSNCISGSTLNFAR